MTNREWTIAGIKFHAQPWNIDLLDHRTGEVIRIAPWLGMTVGGGLNKAEILKRMTQ